MHGGEPPDDRPVSTLAVGAEQDLIRTIVECVADGVLVVDDTGHIRFANPAAGRLFGRDVDDLIGTEFGFPIVGLKTTEIDIARRGGELVTAELRIADTTLGGEHVSVVSLRDVTERKRAEETARELVHEKAGRPRGSRTTAQCNCASGALAV